MTNAIILAGGRGSRLGPLAAQISKALVSVGQRPHIIHQILHLHSQGVTDIVVVVSPETQTQVRNLLDRSGISGKVKVSLAVQESPLGPVHATAVGAQALAGKNARTYVIMSDTYTEQPFRKVDHNWVGVAQAPKTRSFCYRDDDGQYHDGVVPAGALVTVGVYHFMDLHSLHLAAAKALIETGRQYAEVPMSELLNRITIHPRVVDDWLDLGDVISLAESRRTKFIVRDHHELNLDDNGVITKRGYGTVFRKSSEWLRAKSRDSRLETSSLFPQVYNADATSIMMEHLDMPTLSELWLYWPGRPDTWADILERVISRVNTGLWSTGSSGVRISGDDLSRTVFDRAVQRINTDSRVGAISRKTITRLLHDAEVALRSGLDSDRYVIGHGDLNFSNILYSINTGAVKLIDPRGDDRIPLIYEFAKLRYSYHGGFSAITHGLTLHDRALLPFRSDESDALDTVITRWYDLDLVQLVEGSLLLAGSALHNDSEANVMRLRGIALLQEALSE